MSRRPSANQRPTQEKHHVRSSSLGPPHPPVPSPDPAQPRITSPRFPMPESSVIDPSVGREALKFEQQPPRPCVRVAFGLDGSRPFTCPFCASIIDPARPLCSVSCLWLPDLLGFYSTRERPREREPQRYPRAFAPHAVPLPCRRLQHALQHCGSNAAVARFRVPNTCPTGMYVRRPACDTVQHQPPIRTRDPTWRGASCEPRSAAHGCGCVLGLMIPRWVNPALWTKRTEEKAISMSRVPFSSSGSSAGRATTATPPPPARKSSDAVLPSRVESSGSLTPSPYMRPARASSRACRRW